MKKKVFENTTVKDLVKRDLFGFNKDTLEVKIKWRNDDKPLVTTCGQEFSYEELEVVFMGKRDRSERNPEGFQP